MKRRTMRVTTVGVGAPAVERGPYEEDAEQHHQEVGRHWEVGLAEVAGAVAEVREALAAQGVSGPAGWAPLPIGAVVAIVRQLGLHRGQAGTCRFRADGRAIPDDVLGQHSDVLGRDSYVELTPAEAPAPGPLYRPNLPASEVRRLAESQVHEAQLEDARELARWWCEPPSAQRPGRPRRCWCPGMPAPVDPVLPDSEPLSSAARRRILSVMERHIDDPPALREGIRVFEPDSGEPAARDGIPSFFPGTKYENWGPEQFLVIRYNGDSLDEVSALLDRVRIRRRPAADGRSEVVTVVQ